METRAHFILIGTFTIAAFVGLFVFVLWFARVEIDREWSEYEIIFTSQVTGLSEGGQVRYSGIPVGEVLRLYLNPDNPSQVVARVRIDAATPVTTDSKASLEFQGLTGVAYILLSGGGPESAKLEPPEGGSVPVIIAERSGFQELVSGAPDLIMDANQAVRQLQLLLSQENIESITQILDDTSQLTESVAGRRAQVGELLDNLSQVSGDLAGATSDLSELSKTANTLLQDDGQSLVKEMRAATQSIKTLSDNANAVVVANAGSIETFSEDGLAQFGLFVSESRELVDTLNRVLVKLESDPAQYLSGNHAAEYEPQ